MQGPTGMYTLRVVMTSALSSLESVLSMQSQLAGCQRVRGNLGLRTLFHGTYPEITFISYLPN